MMTLRYKPVGFVALLGCCLSAGAWAQATAPAPAKDDYSKLPGCVETKGRTPCAKDPAAKDAVRDKDAGGKGPAAPASPSVPASPAAAFPFPTEDSKHGGDVQGDEAVPAAPAPAKDGQGAAAPNQAPGSAGAPTGNAAKDHPFPGEPAGDVPSPPGRAPSDSSGSSSSSSGDGISSSRDAMGGGEDEPAPTTADPDAPVKAAPLKDLGTSNSTSKAREQLEAKRFENDMKVGDFYRKDGNLQGAYLRYKDAVEHQADDPDAQFYLADVALKLGKKDEAKEHFAACLKLDDGGEHAKDARKNLAALGGGAPLQ